MRDSLVLFINVCSYSEIITAAFPIVFDLIFVYFFFYKTFAITSLIMQSIMGFPIIISSILGFRAVSKDKAKYANRFVISSKIGCWIWILFTLALFVVQIGTFKRLVLSISLIKPK